MFVHTVDYIDFNGNERSDKLYFHLNLPEVTRIQAEIGTDIKDHIKDLVDNNKFSELLSFMELILLNAYGEKTTDGKTFHKTKEMRHSFEHSQAYAEVFEQVLTDKQLAMKFGEQVAASNKAKKNQVNPEVVQG